MGIPSYFSSIVRNYKKIINNHQFHKINTPCHCLFMDCNSIIYDAFHALNKETPVHNVENIIIENVISKINCYIQNINPTNILYIAFDGVAPFAKMEQQRKRRYKSWFQTTVNEKDNTAQTFWNSCSITPGTNFMNTLSKTIQYAFENKECEYNVQKIIVSGSNENGEGEHKLFRYLRKNNCLDFNVFVYGLDSDLIMLSIFHHRYCKNILVFREAPEFIKSKVADVSQKDDLLFMDIGILNTAILNEMDCKFNDTQRIYDYIFMCFLLGNDFLPHFPSLNIRTHGIDILMDTYKYVIGNYPNRFFISKKTGNIQWRFFGMFIEELAKNEQDFVIREYNIKSKMGNMIFSVETEEERENILTNAPIIIRNEENYIWPYEKYWEERYYKTLFKIPRSKENLKNICNNYLEGMEWVFKYYTEDCPDWKWKYNYNYPPLLMDLSRFVPHFETDFISAERSLKKSFTDSLQLAFVVPPVYHKELLGESKSRFLLDYKEYYHTEWEFQWAFCRYFWESHIVLPEIPIELLEKWNHELVSL